MNNRNENPYRTPFPVDKLEPIRQALWGKEYREREARSKYLLDLIARQQDEAPARNAQQAT